MAYKVILHYPDGTDEELDEEFSTRSAAQSEAEYQIGCYDTGGEVLNMSNPGDYPLDNDEMSFEIIEV